MDVAGTMHVLGMVSKVFPAAELSDLTVEFARRIARVPSMAALLIKESVNQAQDTMGFTTALNSCFTLHQLNHAHWSEVSGGTTSVGTVDHGLDDWRAAPAIRMAARPACGSGRLS